MDADGLCPSCRRAVPVAASVCAFCGARFGRAPRRGLSVGALLGWTALIGLIGTLVLVLSVYWPGRPKGPEGAAADWRRAARLRSAGRLDAAIAAQQQFLEAESTSWRGWRELGEMLFAVGRYGESVDAYGRAVEHAADESPQERAWLLRDRAVARLGAGDYRGGDADLDACAALHADVDQTPSYLVPRAICLAGRGRQEAAMRALGSSVEVDPAATTEAVAAWLDRCPEGVAAPVLRRFLRIQQATADEDVDG